MPRRTWIGPCRSPPTTDPDPAWACFRGPFLAGDLDLDGMDEHRWQADALRASLAETLVADPQADLAIRVEAVELLWQEQPWRTDAVEQVADSRPVSSG